MNTSTVATSTALASDDESLIQKHRQGRPTKAEVIAARQNGTAASVVPPVKRRGPGRPMAAQKKKALSALIAALQAGERS